MGDDYSDFPGAVPPGQAFQIAKEWHNKGYTEKDAITQ